MRKGIKQIEFYLSVFISVIIVFVLITGCSDSNSNGIIDSNRDNAPALQLDVSGTYDKNGEPRTLITFDLPTGCNYELNIRNSTGYLVKQFTGHGVGRTSIEWNLKSDNGKEINRGFYLYEVIVIGDKRTLLGRVAQYIYIP